MKILFAEGHILSISRFREQEAFVLVISAEDIKRTIRLPLGAVGASSPCGENDIFGCPLKWQPHDQHSIMLEVEAHHSYFFRCQIM